MGIGHLDIYPICGSSHTRHNYLVCLTYIYIYICTQYVGKFRYINIYIYIYVSNPRSNTRPTCASDEIGTIMGALAGDLLTH